MGISSLGIGAGIDLKSLLESMKEAQQERLKPIIQQKNDIDAKVSAYGQLKNRLSALNTASEKLQKADTFGNRTATPTSDAFTATVRSGTELGNYSIQIDQIATSHSVASNEISDSTVFTSGIEPRKITIKQEDGTTLEVELKPEHKTIQDIANAINQAILTNLNGTKKPSPIAATVVRSSQDSSQLVLSSKQTGKEYTISSVSSSDAALNNIIGYDNNAESSSAMSEISVGQDAIFRFNGIRIQNASNTITDVISNLDITLKNVTSNTEQLTIEANNEDTKNAIKAWVDSFNQLKATISAATQYTPAENNATAQNKNNGPLLGDSVVRSLDNNIRSALSAGQSGEFKVLSEIGIDMDISSSRLTINESKLDEALDKNSEAVSALFIGDGKTTGIANQIGSIANNYIESNGTISAAEKGLASRLKLLNQRYDQINNSIEQSIDRYRTQFNRLDTMSSSLAATGKSLSAQLGAAG